MDGKNNDCFLEMEVDGNDEHYFPGAKFDGEGEKIPMEVAKKMPLMRNKNLGHFPLVLHCENERARRSLRKVSAMNLKTG